MKWAEKNLDGSVCATEPPEVVEGVIVKHCAYVRPAHGEIEWPDSGEVFALLILDTPVMRLESGWGGMSRCFRNFTMVQVVAEPDGTRDPVVDDLVGKRARIPTHGLMEEHSARHHTRFVVRASAIQVLGSAPEAPERSLRSTWGDHEHDFLGTPCPGFP